MNFTHIEITTERLILEYLTPKWREDIFREFTQEITRYMRSRPTETIAGTDEFIASSIEKMANGEEVVCVIVSKETGEFIGIVAAHKLNTTAPEIGIWTKKSAHGNHYGREAAHGVKKWMDETGCDYSYITYPVCKLNTASRKIAESLGGRVEREMQSPNVAGELMDQVEYKIYK